MTPLLDAGRTAARLPYAALAQEIRALLADASVVVPQRLVQPLAGGGTLFVMPAMDSRIAITKLITFTPANAGTGRPAIQGDVVVFDGATGARTLILDGPTVTARRTAAVSLVAAQQLAPNPAGPLLVVGAGAQGRAHVEAFAQGLRIQEVFIVSRGEPGAQALAAHARALGLRARVAASANAVLADCPLVVTCTPAGSVVLDALPRADAFICAVGAFTPEMVELGPALCRHCATRGQVVVDTPQAVHEAGDLLQAGLDVASFATLRDVVSAPHALPGRPRARRPPRGAAQPLQPQAWGQPDAARPGPVLFKSCGWAGWDLAAARLAVATQV